MSLRYVRMYKYRYIYDTSRVILLFVLRVIIITNLNGRSEVGSDWQWSYEIGRLGSIP